MNKILFLTLAAMFVVVAACGKPHAKAAKKSQRVLVAYFSATGTTARAAKLVAAATGGELYAIAPTTPYTAADLNWHDKSSRSSVEMNNAKARPTIASRKANIGNYDVLFLGYPIWWNQAPRIVNTFIEAHGLKGVVIVPFATSGSSGIENSVKQLRTSYPAIKWQQGKLLNKATPAAVKQWTQSLGY